MSSQKLDRALGKAHGERTGTVLAAGPRAATCHLRSRDRVLFCCLLLMEELFIRDAVACKTQHDPDLPRSHCTTPGLFPPPEHVGLTHRAHDCKYATKTGITEGKH